MEKIDYRKSVIELQLKLLQVSKNGLSKDKSESFRALHMTHEEFRSAQYSIQISELGEELHFGAQK